MQTWMIASIGAAVVVLFGVIVFFVLRKPSGKASSGRVLRTIDGEKGLKIEVMKEGKGAKAASGQKVAVHYTGKLTDGKVFDTSAKRGRPLEFSLGSGQVIKGWEIGVQGMKPGEKRRLTIPPILGYGMMGNGGVIPPNATLIFDVELVSAN